MVEGEPWLNKNSWTSHPDQNHVKDQDVIQKNSTNMTKGRTKNTTDKGDNSSWLIESVNINSYIYELWKVNYKWLILTDTKMFLYQKRLTIK